LYESANGLDLAQSAAFQGIPTLFSTIGEDGSGGEFDVFDESADRNLRSVTYKRSMRASS
jgi:hypothetical protein